MTKQPPPNRRSGRAAEAARNDARILDAARAVLLANPGASLAAVSQAAGVGMSAVYRRYGNRNVLVGAIAEEGMHLYIAEVKRALASPADPWAAYVEFLFRILVADTHALVVRLAGTFRPTPAQFALADELGQLNRLLFARAAGTGRLRTDVTELDVSHMMELLSRRVIPDAARSLELRERILQIFIDGLGAAGPAQLRGTPPSYREWGARWE